MSTPKRGRDVRKMEKPYTCREVLFTCSNGWTIERVSPEDFNMEGFFMGHCLGKDEFTTRSLQHVRVLSLREPDGTPHATITGYEMVGRCNQAPKDSYCALIWEYLPEARPINPSKFQLDYRRPEGETLDDAMRRT